MKNYSRSLIALATLACLACGGDAFAAPTKAAWTLLIYQDADNNLEKPAMVNLNEMLRAEIGPEAPILVLCDRSPLSEPQDEYTDEAVGGLKDWSGAKLLAAQKGKLIEIENWGDVNMADPKTLKRFLDAAVKVAPAEHYGLIISDHGDGWSELCVDETHHDDALTLRGLRGALEEFAAKQGKLDLVGLDACLMGNFETAQALAPVAHVLVASEEFEPAHGWNYTALLNALHKNPALTGPELGKIAAESYYQYYAAADGGGRGASSAITMSAISLDRLDPLQKALTALGDVGQKVLHARPRAGWVRLARARADSEEYGSEGGRGRGGEEMHDLQHIARIMQTPDEPELSAAAKTVEDAAKAVIIYNAHGADRPHSTGLSIYFPVDGLRDFDPHARDYRLKTFAMESRWIHFLALYAYAVSAAARDPRLKPVRVRLHQAHYGSQRNARRRY